MLGPLEIECQTRKDFFCCESCSCNKNCQLRPILCSEYVYLNNSRKAHVTKLIDKKNVNYLLEINNCRMHFF
jgi:hypothetical protein